MRRSFEEQSQCECKMKTLYTDFVVERAIDAILLCAEDVGLIDSTVSDMNDDEIRQLTKCEAISSQAENRVLGMLMVAYSLTRQSFKLRHARLAVACTILLTTTEFVL